MELEVRDVHRDGRPPNRLVVHRRGVRPAEGEEQSLTYELHCSSSTSQVQRREPTRHLATRTWHLTGCLAISWLRLPGLCPC